MAPQGATYCFELGHKGIPVVHTGGRQYVLCPELNGLMRAIKERH